MSNLISHAERELDALIATDNQEEKDEYTQHLKKNVLDLMAVFAEQGHSGSSAPMVSKLFYDLANFKPLLPITGNDNEWGEVDGGIFQNSRCGAVFKNGKEGKPYYLDAIVWQTQNGGSYTGSAILADGKKIPSRQWVRLPFTPKTFYINVIEKEVAPDDWEFTVKDETQLAEVFAYYDRNEIV
ncbi:hypothetical protein [Spirosoma sordidisoli]|uniref:Uncharacterized protein n=1 Tax=Spirosoma sordidisoli TaxID=2502893 RepID=A0A4Q2UM74_9BACT|nr:hypothetical protein [Spirosoma sordidisoli]RYC70693.1 hypothetical protein EQG79_00645 [Spirosoma sordidisoli]